MNNNFFKVVKILVCFIIFFSVGNKITGTQIENENNDLMNSAKEDISEGVNFDEFVNTMDEYIKDNNIADIDLNEIANDMLNGKETDYNGIFIKILSLFSKDIVKALTGGITILIIVIIMGVISSMELESKSDVTKIAHLACFLVIATITISSFIEIITNFKDVVSTLTTIMQVISPFLMAILLATGAITSTGIIEPLLLFIASAIGFIINYIVVPFMCISVAFNVISSMSQNLRLTKMSKLFNSTSLWIIGIIFTVFLGILSLETSLSSSVDTLAVKTTQAAVSNFVPVVGKFFSDSFETVVGATKIISKVGGTIGILAVILIAITPIIKILTVLIIYKILAALIEPICDDENISKYISGFASTYQTILGILIGISILFVISTGIILNLSSQIIN